LNGFPRTIFNRSIKVGYNQSNRLILPIKLNKGIYDWHGHFQVNDFFPLDTLYVDASQREPVVEGRGCNILCLSFFLVVGLIFSLNLTQAVLSCKMTYVKSPGF
jgi:hypothetical protein